jgi:hypothetical protein
MRAVVEAAGDVARVFSANDAAEQSASLVEAMEVAAESERISLTALAARVGPGVAPSAGGGGGGGAAAPAPTKRLGDGQLDVELLLCHLGDCEGQWCFVVVVAVSRLARQAAQPLSSHWRMSLKQTERHRVMQRKPSFRSLSLSLSLSPHACWLRAGFTSRVWQSIDGAPACHHRMFDGVMLFLLTDLISTRWAFKLLLRCKWEEEFRAVLCALIDNLKGEEMHRELQGLGKEDAKWCEVLFVLSLVVLCWDFSSKGL